MRIQTLKNAIKIFIQKGPVGFFKHTIYHIKFMHKKRKGVSKRSLKDVLFINGCCIEYCERYRVLHKMEELTAYGISSDEVVPEELTEELIKNYRTFIIYRAPWSKHLDTFIKLVHENNKVVFYDIDDLVFDLKFVHNIKSLQSLSKEERKNYNAGVIGYGKLLACCDYSITTTKVIAEEMKKHVKDVYIDKNIASLKMQKYSEIAINEVKKDPDKIVIGYASGSLTHNDDFALIQDAIKKILDKYPNVYFKFIGVIDIPEEFKKYGDRILTVPFVDYKKLPMLIRSLDINLAPLETSIFNAAKSSIKWMEAGLVKIPTVASDVGNFHDSITDGVDGILCKDSEWFKKLEKLVTDSEYRKKIGEGAYKTVYSHYTPNTSGKELADFIKTKLNKNIMFVIPTAKLSGGLMVIARHAAILKKAGYDVSLLNMDLDSQLIEKIYSGGTYIPVISNNNLKKDMEIHTLVATMWFTTDLVKSYPKCKNIKYLVQGREDGFYKGDDPDILSANASYNLEGIKYITISKWCKKWLKEDFNQDALYAPNGIDLSLFKKKSRNFKGKIKILIEGDSNSYYKNVDESFRIANKLDSSKYEISYLSYNGKPKEWYRVDKFYNKVAYEKVHEIYERCDILLKSSYLESFSYPPLEMMATGGIPICVLNNGNSEFLKDEVNCLIYEQGNIDDALNKIELIINNKPLRDKIISNGLETAKKHSWKNFEDDIIKLYIDENV